MNKKLESDIIDASDATEHLLKRLPELSLEDQVDIAARLRAVVKNCGAIDEIIKDNIKKKLKGKEGTCLGDVFKANLAVVMTTRLDTTKLKTEQPAIYDKFSVEQEQKRITFEPR